MLFPSFFSKLGRTRKKQNKISTCNSIWSRNSASRSIYVSWIRIFRCREDFNRIFLFFSSSRSLIKMEKKTSSGLRFVILRNSLAVKKKTKPAHFGMGLHTKIKKRGTRIYVLWNDSVEHLKIYVHPGIKKRRAGKRRSHRRHKDTKSKENKSELLRYGPGNGMEWRMIKVFWYQES